MATRQAPQNPIHERYASAEMAEIFTTRTRYQTWRQIWIALARSQKRLGLPISDDQLQALEKAAPRLDLARAAEIERDTRHDVVAHIRHFAEQAGEAGGVLHLGATSAFITDNTDLVLMRRALSILERRLGAVVENLAEFAHRTRAIPCLAYTHFQPAQLTTIGKRAALWLQDFLSDLTEIQHRSKVLKLRGAKGTTGTQASYLTLFEGDHQKVERLDELIAEELGFSGTFPVTGQTYSRKQDSRVLAALSGIGESAHKVGTDIRLLQGLGELSEPFGEHQVGSSAMAYKRNPIRSERMCALARRLITDALNGPLTTATQWLERSLDDSANRRLVLPDTLLTADAVLVLAAHLAGGLRVNEVTVKARVERELPFMATETLLMLASLKGGDRQVLHERLRQLSLKAQDDVAAGGPNPLLSSIVANQAFGLTEEEIAACVKPELFTGRAQEQVESYLQTHVEPILQEIEVDGGEGPEV